MIILTKNQEFCRYSLSEELREATTLDAIREIHQRLAQMIEEEEFREEYIEIRSSGVHPSTRTRENTPGD